MIPLLLFLSYLCLRYSEYQNCLFSITRLQSLYLINNNICSTLYIYMEYPMILRWDGSAENVVHEWTTSGHVWETFQIRSFVDVKKRLNQFQLPPSFIPWVHSLFWSTIVNKYCAKIIQFTVLSLVISYLAIVSICYYKQPNQPYTGFFSVLA